VTEKAAFIKMKSDARGISAECSGKTHQRKEDMMQALTKHMGKAGEEQRPNKDDMEKEVDLEMEECLAKLTVWQTENLMAPHGMERFLGPPKRAHSASLFESVTNP